MHLRVQEHHRLNIKSCYGKLRTSFCLISKFSFPPKKSCLEMNTKKVYWLSLWVFFSWSCFGYLYLYIMWLVSLYLSQEFDLNVQHDGYHMLSIICLPLEAPDIRSFVSRIRARVHQSFYIVFRVLLFISLILFFISHDIVTLFSTYKFVYPLSDIEYWFKNLKH